MKGILVIFCVITLGATEGDNSHLGYEKISGFFGRLFNRAPAKQQPSPTLQQPKIMHRPHVPSHPVHPKSTGILCLGNSLGEIINLGSVLTFFTDGFFYQTAEDLWTEVFEGGPQLNVPKRQIPRVPQQHPQVTQFVQEKPRPKPKVPHEPLPRPHGPVNPQRPVFDPQRIPQPEDPQDPDYIVPQEPEVPEPVRIQPFATSEMRPLKPFVFFSQEENTLPSPFDDFSQKIPQLPTEQPQVLPQPNTPILTFEPDYPEVVEPNFDFDFDFDFAKESQGNPQVPNQFAILETLNTDPRPNPTPVLSLEEAILANSFKAEIPEIPNEIETDPIYEDYQNFMEEEQGHKMMKLTPLQKSILKNAGITDIPDEIEIRNTKLPKIVNIFAEDENNLSSPTLAVAAVGDGQTQFFEVVNLVHPRAAVEQDEPDQPKKHKMIFE